jgi:hypothetical protein
VVFVFALLLAYQPASASDLAQDQEVSALVAQVSDIEAAVPFNASIEAEWLSTQAPDAEQAAESQQAAATSVALVEESSARLHESTRSDFSGLSRPWPITTGEYDVLLLPMG